MGDEVLFKDWEKPSWNEYYMGMAFQIAMRSIDPSTKQGCIVVGPHHEPLTLGYNSPPRGCLDHLIPITRPEKYPYMIHAEENAIANAARKGIALIDSTFYITGHPCSDCFKLMLQVGAKKIIYGPVTSNQKCISPKDLEAIALMLKGREGFPFEKFSGNLNQVSKLMRMAADYLDSESKRLI